jgi:glycosidase
MKKILFLVVVMMACGSKDDNTPVVPVDDEPKQYGTPFGGVSDPQDIVLYEVNVRSFSTAGNLQGVIDRLENIKALGINTIWLMPINPVGKLKSAGDLGSPYSVQNYTEVNPDFGTKDKLRELVDKAHAKNMAVIMDWVANHTAWDNPWITAHKSWYTQDASGNIIIPPNTNWQDVAELNYSNPDMRTAMIAAMKYWVVEANVDGFRCDAVDFVPADFWKQAITELKTIKDRKLILLAEGGKSENFTSGFQMNYAWDFYTAIKAVYQQSKAATTLFTTHQAEYNAIPAGGYKMRYTTNHDVSAYESTPVSLFGGIAGALSASVITIFTSPVPMIYSSQEVGQATNLPIFTRNPINWAANQNMLQQYEKLFSIYNSTQAFKKGSLTYYANSDVAAFKRISGDDEFLILVNVRANTIAYTLADEIKDTSWTNAVDGSAVSLTTTLSLSPFQYLILKK